MTYEYIGKIIEVLQVEDISRNAKTLKKKQTIVCQEKDNKCAFLIFDDRIDEWKDRLVVGKKVKITFSIKASIRN